MKTVKVTADNKVSVIDVDFSDFRDIQKALGGTLRGGTYKNHGKLFHGPVGDYAGRRGRDYKRTSGKFRWINIVRYCSARKSDRWRYSLCGCGRGRHRGTHEPGGREEKTYEHLYWIKRSVERSTA